MRSALTQLVLVVVCTKLSIHTVLPAVASGQLRKVGLLQARRWVTAWVHWYNDEHRHSAIRFVTPAQRHAQVDKKMLQARAQVYALARQQNPLRWSGQTRNWSFIEEVHLNPDKPQPKEPDAVRKAA